MIINHSRWSPRATLQFKSRYFGHVTELHVACCMNSEYSLEVCIRLVVLLSLSGHADDHNGVWMCSERVLFISTGIGIHIETFTNDLYHSPLYIPSHETSPQFQDRECQKPITQWWLSSSRTQVFVTRRSTFFDDIACPVEYMTFIL